MTHTEDIRSARSATQAAYSHRALWNAEAERYSLAPTARFADDPFLKIVAASGALTPESRVLDLGCGPGIYSAALAERAAEVLGLDVSEEMIARAQARVRDAKLANCRFARIDWQRADPAALGLTGAFDVAVARLTPAVDDLQSVEKLIACAARRVFIENFIDRQHPWMTLAFEMAGAGKPWHDERLFEMTAYLLKTGRRPRLHYRRAEWGSPERPWQQVADFCLRRLALRMPVDDALRADIEHAFERRSRGGMLDAREGLTLMTIEFSPTGELP